MSCRRLRRELIELFRFGGLDWRSAPHLDHLADCRACRDEVGLDRALVQQLRVALAERIAGAAPSADAWASILARAQAPSSGFGGWLRAHGLGLAARLRTATAISAMALAVVISAGTDAAIRFPQAGPDAAGASDILAERREVPAARPEAPASEARVEVTPPSVVSTGRTPSPPESSSSAGLLSASTLEDELEAGEAPYTDQIAVWRDDEPTEDIAGPSSDLEPPAPAPTEGPF